MADTRSERVAGSYRPDIDGLRAVAVLCVVLYHIGVPGFSAGFVGVDVFFVISGYLITAHLCETRGTPLGRSLLDFYARRARRILPPLALVVVATIALGKLLLLPYGEHQDLAKSGIAAALFVSNVFFLRNAHDYFAGPAELAPLLHTWSLAVEEQFYLLWPLFLALIWASVRRWPRWPAGTCAAIAIGIVSLASLVLSEAWARTDPGAAFFLMPSRLWELGAGAALAAIVFGHGALPLPRGAGPLGLAAIAAAVFFYTPRTPFPGVTALVPVLGAALILAAGGRTRSGPVYRLLASRPMTETGKLSYSWYLWHWPFLAIARAMDLGGHRLARDSLLAALAYVIAYASTRYVEAPIREQQVRIFSGVRASLASGLAMIVIPALLSVGLWLPARERYRAELAPRSLDCIRQTRTTSPEREAACVLASGNGATAYLIGDSHANHWSPAIALWAQAAGVRAIERSFSACPVGLARVEAASDVPGTDYPVGCISFSADVVGEIERTAGSGTPTLVILSVAWKGYRVLETAGHANSFAATLDQRLAAFERAGGHVLVIGSTPNFDHDVPACLARRAEVACRISRLEHDSRTAALNAALREIVVRHPTARFVDPTSSFCDESWCYPTRGGATMFRDAGHLSRLGAELGSAAIGPELDRLLGEVRVPRAASAGPRGSPSPNGQDRRRSGAHVTPE